MSFKKLLILSVVASFSIFSLHAENHDTEQNIKILDRWIES